MSTTATAQSVDSSSNDIGSLLTQTVGNVLRTSLQAMNDTIGVSPSVIAVDLKTSTATVHFLNVFPHDTMLAEITLQRSDSLHSLAPWVTDLPARLIMLPGQTRTVTLHLSVPTGLSPGRYTATLAVATQVVKNVAPKGQQPHLENEHFDRPPATATILYQVGNR